MQPHHAFKRHLYKNNKSSHYARWQATDNQTKSTKMEVYKPNMWIYSKMTATQIAETYGVSDTHAITTFSRYVDMPARQLTEAICIDEVYIDIDFKHKYALVIQDFISGEPLDMLPSRRQEITEPYFANIPIKQRTKVKYLVTDMYRPYHSFVDVYFPNAISVIDSFHVVKMINHHLHKHLLKLIRKYRDIDPDLKHLRDLKEKYIRFNKQYGGKYKEAKEKLRDIIAEYDNCPYDMFHTIADSLRYHFDAITNSFIMVERHCHGDTYIKRLSNGPAEALNRIVKDMKRNGRGYKNFDHLRNRFLYSQRANAAILGTPKPLEEVLFKTGISRGPYSKKSR